MYVEDEKMEAVLKHLHSRISWQKVRQAYEDWEETFKMDQFKWLGLRDLDELSKVFYFKGKDITRCRNEFIHFLKLHQEFYNDDIEIVFQRMKEAREVYNTNRAMANELPIPFVNWIPDYGGRVQGTKREQGEIEWHRENEIPFALDGSTPPKKRSPSRSRPSENSGDDCETF